MINNVSIHCWVDKRGSYITPCGTVLYIIFSKHDFVSYIQGRQEGTLLLETSQELETVQG